MTNIQEKVRCAKLDLSADGAKIWTKLGDVDLIIDEMEIKFEDWVIPVKNIENAILNKERHLFFFNHYSLLLETNIGSYLFNLNRSDVWERLPFEVKRTYGESFEFSSMYRTSFVLIALVLLVLLLDFLT